jgi:hypothetical protein
MSQVKSLKHGGSLETVPTALANILAKKSQAVE